MKSIDLSQTVYSKTGGRTRKKVLDQLQIDKEVNRANAILVQAKMEAEREKNARIKASHRRALLLAEDLEDTNGSKTSKKEYKQASNMNILITFASINAAQSFIDKELKGGELKCQKGVEVTAPLYMKAYLGNHDIVSVEEVEELEGGSENPLEKLSD